MEKEISREQYPYEMYCMTCDHVAAYLDHKPEVGSAIQSKGAINLDGTFPVPGSVIHCECQPGTRREGWAARVRPALSKCCGGRMIGGVQCEVCGSNGE